MTADVPAYFRTEESRKMTKRRSKPTPPKAVRKGKTTYVPPNLRGGPPRPNLERALHERALRQERDA